MRGRGSRLLSLATSTDGTRILIGTTEVNSNMDNLQVKNLLLQQRATRASLSLLRSHRTGRGSPLVAKITCVSGIL